MAKMIVLEKGVKKVENCDECWIQHILFGRRVKVGACGSGFMKCPLPDYDERFEAGFDGNGRPENMKGAVFLCHDCNTVFIMGPNNLQFMSRYTCYGCNSTNVEHRPELYDQVTIDNQGHEVVPVTPRPSKNDGVMEKAQHCGHELTSDEHMMKYPDQWYIGGQPKPDTEAERLFSHDLCQRREGERLGSARAYPITMCSNCPNCRASRNGLPFFCNDGIHENWTREIPDHRSIAPFCELAQQQPPAPDVLAELVELIDCRYEGMKNFYETPSDRRTGTDRETFLMLEEIRIIRDCMEMIIGEKEIAMLRQGTIISKRDECYDGGPCTMGHCGKRSTICGPPPSTSSIDEECCVVKQSEMGFICYLPGTVKPEKMVGLTVKLEDSTIVGKVSRVTMETNEKCIIYVVDSQLGG